ncbi:hypothetical protein HV096_19270 [Citrobacter freundii]|nr:hypothetical protein [Citrobacter freundii]MBA8034186.1 hypothetical protein [Citrobacter freundii]
MKEQFEKWVMVASSGNADLTLNIHGEYDSPETSGFYELYKLARVDISQALTDMAVQLANAESKCREMAAENGGLKKAAEFATAPDMWIEQADGMLDYRYCEWYVDVLKAAMETPATDACLAEVRAQGVDMFALMFAEEAIKSNNITTGWRAKASRAASEYAEALREDAAQLRNGAAL